MSKESKSTAPQFDEAAIEAARKRFGYLDDGKEYNIRDLCEALLPDRSHDSAGRTIRKAVRAIHEQQGVQAPSGQYRFTLQEATIMSLEIERMWSDEPAPVAETSPPDAQDPAAAVSGQPIPAQRSADKKEEKAADEKAVTAPAKRRIRGSVVSKSGNKSIVVLVQRKVKHPLYKKYIKRSTRLHAHDERNESAVGDIVRIESCRPVSKTKCWRLVEVVSHVQ